MMTMMTILTAKEANDRLLELAKGQQIVDDLKEKRRAMLKHYIDPIDDAIRGAVEGVAGLDEILRQQFLAHVEAGGATDLDPSLTFRRTKKFEYDKDHALQFVLDNNLPYTRIKTTLDANAFKKACQDGTIDYADGETINVPSVAIGKLGHMLIFEESEFEE